MMRKDKKKVIHFALVIGVMTLLLLGMEAYASEDRLAEAKNGIVEIMSGFTDSKGEFYCVKSGSGFVIDNTEGETYLLTTNYCAVVTDQEKTDFCAGKGLEIDLTNVQNRVKVIVKDDVTSEASIVAQSAEGDYCVLRTSSVINEKNSLRLGNSDELTTGMTVYAMGFEDDAAANGAEFTAVDVSVREGTIQNVESRQEGEIYQQHSAIISSGNSGGPLLNEAGYVIGMNNSLKSREEEGLYFSFPINEIREVLDNYDIDYYSIQRATAEKEMDSLYVEGKKKYKSGKFKKSSLAELENAMQQVEELKKQEELSEEQVKNAVAELETSIEKLREKMPIKEKVMIGLGILNILLLIWFLCIFFGYRKEKATVSKQNSRKPFHSERITDESDTFLLEKGTRAFSETTVFDDSGNTFSIGNKKAVLVRLKVGESMEIGKQGMCIGKSGTKADMVIDGNPSVSRKHAQITRQGQKFYIRDLGSANGTFINGERITADEDRELVNGDRVKLADEEFEFHEYLG